MNHKSLIRILFWVIAIVAGLFIGAVCAHFDIDKSTLRKVVIAYAVILFASWFAINMIYVSKLANKVNALLPILYDEADPDKYLTELEALIGDARSPAFKSVYYINKATAYYEKEDYAQAKKILLKMDPKKVPGINRSIYQLNMALICMHLKEDDEALKIWKENEKELLKLNMSDNAGAAVSTLRVFALIMEAQFDDARAELDAAREKWIKTRDQREFDFLEEIIICYNNTKHE